MVTGMPEFATKTTTEKRESYCVRLRVSLTAENLKAKLVTELLEKGPPQLVAGKVTFRQLVQHAKDNIYVPAVFDENGIYLFLCFYTHMRSGYAVLFATAPSWMYLLFNSPPSCRT